MKHAKVFVPFARISALLFLVAHTSSAQTYSNHRLQQACAGLQQSPLAPGDLQILAEASRLSTNSPTLHARALAAYSLTFLLQGNTNAFDRAVMAMRVACPSALSHLKVSRDDCFAMCLECLGSGKKSTLCPSCMGSGKCKSCLGAGKKEEALCTACKGKGECVMCAGKKRITPPCPACKGSALIFQPKETIRSNYNALLSEIAAACQEDDNFAVQYGAAVKEPDLNKRVTLLRALVQSYPRRSDLGPAVALLKQSLDAQQAENSRLRAKEKREREDREQADLLKLGEAKIKSLNGAIATLDTYLKGNPDCAGFLELKLLEDELIARRNRYALLKRIMIVAASLVGVLFAVRALRPLVFRKRRSGLSTLPGMDKIDKSQFTDPLKLNAQASKSRVKTKTAEIDPPSQ